MRSQTSRSGAVVLAACLLTGAGCASGPRPGGKDQNPGNHDGCATAVEIHATTEAEGIQAERRWLTENYPGYQLVRQGLGDCDSFPTDAIEIRTQSGETKTVVFNIASFLGKM
jgi:hypothetical protein